ncbi:MAG: J domain-containing protein [Proteobacteria bacterium]|nr:J domain-containing protein [Pseudomonadota bacterium]
MVKRKKLLDWEAPPAARGCEAPGCAEPGPYRAPKSRERLGQYHWFCLEHVREYNAAWNFFEGMDQADIENFRDLDVIGHRPTWPLGLGPLNGKSGSIRDPYRFRAQEAAGAWPDASGDTPKPRARPEQQEALAELELAEETTTAQIRQRYKELVKRYHPDLNGGDKRGEERLKDVNRAYAVLMDSGYG